MSRDHDYINISRPRVRSPGLSHDLQLLRDLEIANARTTAELGPLPSGGLPVVTKAKFIPSQSATPPARAQENLENQEEKTMKLHQMVIGAALATGIAACEPSSEPAAAQAPLKAPTSNSPTRPTEAGAPSQTNKARSNERTTVSIAPEVPKEIRAFVPLDSTLLAYRRFDLRGDGMGDAVLIVRHPVTETYADFSKNPCELIVLHGDGMGFKLAAKSSKVVDCTYKLYAREIASKPDDLNDFMELGLEQIVFEKETDKPTGVSTTYSFRYSTKKDSWYLSYARAAFARSERIGEEYEDLEDGEWELNVYTQVVRYPEDIPFIPLSRFDPDDELLLRAMVKNQKKAE